MKLLVPVLFVLGVLATANGDPPAAEGKADQGKKPPARFTVSKETTYVTGPIDRDGWIDYAAALNERLGKGITAQNNANVLLWKAIGPRPEGAAVSPEVFRILGIDKPPEEGDYLISLGRYVKEHLKIEPGERANAIYEQQGWSTQRPWVAKDYPEIAGWIKANEKPLAVAVEASKRPEYFNPLVPPKSEKGSGGLIGALLSSVQKCRELAALLAARAMLRCGEGKFDEAWQDLLACHRLGRLVARGATLIEALVGIAIDAIASNAEVAYLERAKPTAKQAQACLRDLQQLPPMPPIADKIAVGERFMFLDSVQLIQRHGINTLEGLTDGGPPKKPVDEKLQKQIAEAIDWDPVLSSGNRWYDRMAEALRIKDRAAREKELDKIEEALKALKKDAVNAGDVAKALLGGQKPDKAISKAIGDILISLLMPAVRKVQGAADRSEQIQRNLQVAFALAAYHADNGHYPEKLDDLAPKYLAKVPDDLFSGKALIYRPSEGGYLFYSIGVNGRDEGGRWYDDDPPGDDPRVRMPLPELKRKK